MEENHGYILRISSDDWVDQVYELKKYYSGVMRSWKRETPILFAKKTDVARALHRIRNRREGRVPLGADPRGGGLLQGIK